MSKGYDLSGYVDVATRIAEFSVKFPEGSLQSELERVDGGWLCKAYAFRTPADERPGIGHAFEPIPGKTPYTRDSEAMNAETSAWGRAIVALGFETKHVASRNEIEARRDGEEGAFQAPEDVKAKGITKPQMALIGAVMTKLQQAGVLTVEELRMHSNAQFGKTSRKDLTSREASALVEWLKDKEAAAIAAGTIPEPDIPF